MHLLLIIIMLLGSSDNTPAGNQSFRIAVFNIKELSTDKLKNVNQDGIGQDKQLEAAAQIIQHVDADILIINELDHDYCALSKGLKVNADRFLKGYLNHESTAPVYPYVFVAPCNTGILSGFDLNNDGIIATEEYIGSREYGGDCFGYGSYPGQYAMGVYSKFPIDTLSIRTFQKFLWKDLQGHHMPEDYYSEDAKKIFRLSSKSHWDIPVLIGTDKVHLFLSHPTPPVFDGDEDRNGRRNFDEIKFWVHYISGDSLLYDDNGVKGGSKIMTSFIIAGDLNASLSSESRYDNMAAIEQLLNDSRLQDSGKWLVSQGGWEGRKKGSPDYWEGSTALFGRDFRTRIDYILPANDLEIIDGGVFWPSSKEDPGGHRNASIASDHRLIWLDLELP